MGRKVDQFILLVVCGLLVFAVVKLVNNKLEIARLPRPVLEAVEAKFPHAYQSRVGMRAEAGLPAYDMFIRQDGEAYVVTVRPDGTILGVSRQAERRSHRAPKGWPSSAK